MNARPDGARICTEKLERLTEVDLDSRDHEGLPCSRAPQANGQRELEGPSRSRRWEQLDRPHEYGIKRLAEGRLDDGLPGVGVADDVVNGAEDVSRRARRPPEIVEFDSQAHRFEKGEYARRRRPAYERPDQERLRTHPVIVKRACESGSPEARPS